MGARSLALALSAVIATALFSFGQEDVPTFRSDAQLVLTGFHVTAKKQYVSGLTVGVFELLVDGRPRPITTFEGNQRGIPVEIVLLFDTSGSVTGRGLLDDKLFRDDLLAALPGVTLSVYSFGGHGDRLTRFCGATRDAATLQQAFRGVVKKGPGEAGFVLGKPGKDSLIYESIVRTLEESSHSITPGVRMLLVVSDGIPGGDQDPAAAVTAAQEAGVPVYPLLVGHQARISEFGMESSAPPRSGEDEHAFSVRRDYRKKQFDETESQAAAFASLGDATGGRSFDPPELNAAAARDVIRSLADEVRAEYVAGFAPEPGSPPASHRIGIRLKGHKEAKLAGGGRLAVY